MLKVARLLARFVLGLAALAAGPVWLVGASSAEAQATRGTYSISIAAMLLAEPGVETPLPIQIAPSDNLPKSSFIRIRGLPPSVTLSEGHVIAAGSWAVPLSALPTLKLAAPIAGTGKSELTVALVGIDGTVWAESKAALAVIAAASLPVGNHGQAQPVQTTVATVGPANPASKADVPPAITLPESSAGSSASKAPTRTPIKPEDNERAQGLIARGDDMLADGDVAGARLYYQRAADLGLARAAVLLAETYDPEELGRWRITGMRPDVKMARRWYEQALQLGAPEADARLRRLPSP